MLSLPEIVRERIASEFGFAAGKMAEANDLATKMYYFSAFFGELQRALNYAWSDDLALLHLAIQGTHQSIKGRLDLAIAGVEPGLGFPSNLPETLTQFAHDLASAFRSKQIDEAGLYKLLCRAAVLTYVVTGNGYYLYAKGAVKLDNEPLKLGAPSESARPSARSRGAARRKASRP